MSEDLFGPFNDNLDDMPVNDFFNDLGKGMMNAMPRMNEMRTNVSDDGETYHVSAELPGFKKNDIHLDYRDNTLRISAKHNVNKKAENKHGKVIRHEISNSNVARAFRLPNVKFDGIFASYDGGILKVSLPKKHAEKDTSHRIEIK